MFEEGEYSGSRGAAETRRRRDAETPRRGENPIVFPPRSPRLRVRKNAAGKREPSATAKKRDVIKKGNTAVHAETRSSRRESNLPHSALSAPPREKKSGWQTRTLGNGEETRCLKKGNTAVHAETRRRGENPIFFPPRSPRLRVRKNAAGLANENPRQR